MGLVLSVVFNARYIVGIGQVRYDRLDRASRVGDQTFGERCEPVRIARNEDKIVGRLRQAVGVNGPDAGGRPGYKRSSLFRRSWHERSLSSARFGPGVRRN